MEQVQAVRFDNEIILYWEKSAAAVACSYEVWCNDRKAGTTAKTHFTMEGLAPDTSYTVQIKQVSKGEVLAESPKQQLTTALSKKKLDVTKAPYCAVGDGVSMNTEALQQAIDDCGAQEAVYLPAGVYLTGALRLHDDMELYLDQGAVLQGTDKPEDYLPKIWSRFEGTELSCYSSLLNLGELDHKGGYNCHNVIIRGGGTIASGGQTLAERIIALEKENLKDYLASLGDKVLECEKPETIPGRVRPRLINMSNCENIIIGGVTLKNGASWNVHMIYSASIVTFGCTFFSENVWNGDGWDPDSSTDCTIFDCTFYTGDDSVAIKSGKNSEGNQINRPTKHIRIFDCRAAYGHGITIGSEMSGGVEDVHIWDCDMSNSLCGIEIKGTQKRGGYVRNVRVEDCSTARVMFHSVGYNDDGIGAEHAPLFEDCSFENVAISGRYYDHYKEERAYCDVIELAGFEEAGHEIKNIAFRKLTLGIPGESRRQNIALQLCGGISFSDIKCL